MSVTIVSKDDIYVLNHCAKYLARSNEDRRHDYGQYDTNDPRALISEAWRFPIIDSYSDGKDQKKSYESNIVTFVYKWEENAEKREVSVYGTFAALYELIPLKPIGKSLYNAVSVVVEKGHVHYYRFVVNGRSVLDPINPQRVTLSSDKEWSRFFAHMCTETISFERGEMKLLERLTNHILPLRTTEGQRFVNQFLSNADRGSKDDQYLRAYRLEQPVGAANFIDKFLAKEEAHHLISYKISLELIDLWLRQRARAVLPFPYIEPADMPTSLYDDLFDALGNADKVPVQGWDYSKYDNPRFFLQLLRRHTYTGAFSHPKYGGNFGALGWSYLEELTRDAKGTYFDWRRAQEPPLGTSTEYNG
jgi:Gluconate 2-dehydrogenase subunit 3